MTELLTREPITDTRATSPQGGSRTDRPLAQPICMADLVGSLVADAEEAWKAAAEGQPRGPVTGLPMLDSTLGGRLSPGLHVISGDPGSGKTALSLHVARSCQFPVLYVTAEQSPIELFRKHVASVTGTALGDLREAAPKKVKALAERAAAAAPMLSFLDATAGAAPAGQIISLAESLRERFVAQHVLLVIDAAQPWARGAFSGGSEIEVQETGIAELVGVAARLKAPILVLSHRNRASTRDRGPTMTAAKGTADFEHLAETVMHLSREKEEGYAAEERQISVYVAKNRHGQSDYSLNLTFNMETQAIR